MALVLPSAQTHAGMVIFVPACSWVATSQLIVVCRWNSLGATASSGLLPPSAKPFIASRRTRSAFLNLPYMPDTTTVPLAASPPRV